MTEAEFEPSQARNPRRRPMRRLLFFVFWLSLTPTAQAAQDLTSMSLEDLMKLEITTVSRQTSTVGQTPAAVFVITQEMIRRSGATTIPELFRMVPGMN